MKRMTVHDVAEQAGVSLATVDRVLNGRPGVSSAMSERVRATIQKLGFQRDHYAASLATSRRHRFVFVLPKLDRNSFVCTLRQEIATRIEALAPHRMELSLLDYTAFDPHALAVTLEQAARQGCDGVALMAVDAPAVRAAIEALHEAGIAVITLVSDVTPSRRLHCVGIDNVAAGRVAASLVGRFNARRRGHVAMIAGSLALRDHSERILGFTQVMQQEYPDLVLLPAAEGMDDGHVTAELARALLARHDDLVGIYSIGAGNRGIIEALEQSGRQHDVVLVGHELTVHSRRALLSGTFDAVLHQQVSDEITVAVAALKAASDRVAGYVPPPIRIDIFMRDNIA
jgi:LacI family transcriptional regulator, galactose operon repressor